MCNINYTMSMGTVKLENLLSMRVPPFSWDLIGCLFGLLILFYDYNHHLIILGGIVFTSYNVLNVLFDTLTFSCEYTNDLLPKYDELKFYNWTIANKKYNLKDGIKKNKEEKSINETSLILNMDDHLNIGSTIGDVSNLKLELNFYIGCNKTIELLLNYIYLFGITKKNYTRINRDKLKDRFNRFV
jgi:hypothetical protein